MPKSEETLAMAAVVAAAAAAGAHADRACLLLLLLGCLGLGCEAGRLEDLQQSAAAVDRALAGRPHQWADKWPAALFAAAAVLSSWSLSLWLYSVGGFF